MKDYSCITFLIITNLKMLNPPLCKASLQVEPPGFNPLLCYDTDIAFCTDAVNNPDGPVDED